MEDATLRAALKRHWDASDASDFDAEHEIYREDAVLDYPQSGERIRGRQSALSQKGRQPKAQPIPH
jgi:ketosteroid isomerase-like protein